MKKIILTFFVLLLCIQNTYAECLIKNNMGDSLSNYKKNIEKVLSKIDKEIGKTNVESNKFKDSGNDVLSKVIGAYNSTFNFKNYFANLFFETELPKNIEIPKEVKRDVKDLRKIGKKIGTKMEKIIKSGKSSIIIKDFCKDFKDFNCYIDNEIEAGKLIKIILINYKNVETNLLKTLKGEKNGIIKDLNFVENNFNLSLEKNYSPENFSKCNEEKGGFFDTISKSIEEIGSSNKHMKNGVKKWKEAWDLLVGKDMSEEQIRETEKKLLKEELSRQGVSSDNQSNLIKNLDKYNSEGLSENNNFISNTFNSVETKIGNKLYEFKNETIGDFTKFLKDNSQSTGINNDENISLKDIQTGKDNSISINKIKENIDSLYQELIPYTAISETKTDNLESKIINIHIEMTDSINILQKTCKKSVKVCKQQDSARGDCGKCQ